MRVRFLLLSMMITGCAHVLERVDERIRRAEYSDAREELAASEHSIQRWSPQDQMEYALARALVENATGASAMRDSWLKNALALIARYQLHPSAEQHEQLCSLLTQAELEHRAKGAP